MGQNDYFSATWTIGIELFASYVVYMVAVLMMHVERPRIVLIGIIGLLVTPQITDAYEITHYNVSKFQFHLPIFLVGMFLSYSEAHPKAKSIFDKVRNWGYFASSLRNIFLLTIFFVYGSNCGKYHCEHLRDGDCTFWVQVTLNWEIPQMFSLYVAAMAIIVLTLVSETVQKVLMSEWLQFLGRISFSLYLFHEIFLYWPIANTTTQWMEDYS